MINAPLSVVQTYYSEAEQIFYTNDGTLVVPCNATLPDLDIYIGNGTAIIRNSSMVGEPYDNAGESTHIPATTLSTGFKLAMLSTLVLHISFF